MKSRVMGELKKVFRPELLNRIDEIIVFHKLSKDEIMTIVDLLLRRLREQMAQHEVTIELTEPAKELLVDKGYDPAMGARPLRRAIQRFIEDPLADYVLGRAIEPGSTILVSRKLNEDGEPGEEVDITFIPGDVTPEKVTVPPASRAPIGRATGRIGLDRTSERRVPAVPASGEPAADAVQSAERRAAASSPLLGTAQRGATRGRPRFPRNGEAAG